MLRFARNDKGATLAVTRGAAVAMRFRVKPRMTRASFALLAWVFKRHVIARRYDEAN